MPKADPHAAPSTPGETSRRRAAPGEIRQLALPVGDTVGYAFGINDNGQAVRMTGTCATTTLPPAASRHAVLWENGAVTDLGNLGGTYNPAALGVGNVALNVNTKGQVVGSSAIPGSAHNHAFLWSRQTGMKDLGTLPGDVMSAGFWINNQGAVIGASVAATGPPTGNPRPFLWTNGKLLDLTTLVPANSPLQLLPPSSINDRGEISGFGVTSNGEVHAYLLTPAKTSLSD